jgi:hypothetical protein
MMHPKHLLLTTILLAACGSEPSRDTAAGASPDSTNEAPAAVVGDTTGTISPGTAPERGAASIVLAPDGLTVGGGASAPKRLAFGGSQAGVLADVGAPLGEPKEQGIQEECPAGPLYHALYASGLQVVFQDDEFVGWAARAGSTFRTAQGIGPGSTLGELKKAYPAATVQETSLGHEFAAGELYGVVTGPSDSETVEMMFAGTNCIFR